MTWFLSEKAHPDWQKAWELKHEAERKTRAAALRRLQGCSEGGLRGRASSLCAGPMMSRQVCVVPTELDSLACRLQGCADSGFDDFLPGS